VRTVAYNPQDIVVVTTYPGVSTPLRFADDEAIEQESIDAGDRKAWSIKVSARRNILFVRPIARMADTNMTVATNKRVYLFLLNVLQEKESGPKKGGKKGDKQATTYAGTYSMEASRSKALTLSLTFAYPDAGRKSDAAKAADALRDQMENAKRHATGGDYWVSGDEEVSPTDARDDGRFIYLTFARNRSLPNITGVDSNGDSFALNPTVNENTMIIDRMVRHLRIELGGAAACVVNRAFNPDAGTDNKTGTIAPNVIRVLKGDSK
jgi:type IV secretion system protein VirB9